MRPAEAAEQLMLATCVAIVMTGSGDPNQRMWRSILRDCLPGARGCADVLSPIWAAASDLVSATGRDRAAAKTRLNFEIRCYMSQRAARAFDAWQGAGA